MTNAFVWKRNWNVCMLFVGALCVCWTQCKFWKLFYLFRLVLPSVATNGIWLHLYTNACVSFALSFQWLRYTHLLHKYSMNADNGRQNLMQYAYTFWQNGVHSETLCLFIKCRCWFDIDIIRFIMLAKNNGESCMTFEQMDVQRWNDVLCAYMQWWCRMFQLIA